MNELKRFNEQIFEQWKLLSDNNLSYPFLISHEFNFKEEYPKILYFGKETNRYCSGGDKTLENLENLYQRFSTEINSKQTDLRNFIQNFYTYPQENNILYANTILCGKRVGTGTPTLSKKLKQMSVSYLTFLYEYFKPDIIIIVCGNKNPYRRIITSFLNNIHSDLKEIPTREVPLVSNEDGTIFWTKHPTYLRLNSQTNLVQQAMKKKILK